MVFAAVNEPWEYINISQKKLLMGRVKRAVLYPMTSF